MPRAPTSPPAVPPDSVAAVQARLADLSGHLPRRLQQCADHLARHPDSLAVSTVAEVAAGAGVPPSALMRLCKVLGFGGYSDLQRVYRSALSRGLPDYATRLANLKSGPAGHPAALVAEFVEAARLSLEGLTRDLDETVLSQAVEVFSQARVIHLAGYRRALPVAAYLAYVFEKMAIPALLHDRIGGLDQAAALQPGDALLAVTFAPYSAETLALMAAARSRGLPVVALTDPPATPLLRQADVVLTVAEVDFGAFRSLSATTALAIGLAVAVAKRRDG